MEFPTVSPMEHWPRSVFMVFFGAYFAVISLKFFKNINSGATIALIPKSPLLTFRVIPGKTKLTQKDLKAGFVKSYNGPASTAFLGMVFFAAAQLMLVMMFKTVEYIV